MTQEPSPESPAANGNSSASTPNPTGGDPSPLSPGKWTAVGQILPIVATLGFLATVSKLLGDRTPTMLYIVMTPMFYIVAYITVAMFQDLIAKGGHRTVAFTELQWWGTQLLRLMMVGFFLLFIYVMLCMTIGYPQDMRHYLNPAIVRREEWPSKTIKLTSQSALTLKKREPIAAGAQPANDQRNRLNIWEEWLYKGATTDKATSLMVYKTDAYKSYYVPTAGHVVFPDASDSIKLADCVAFIVSIDEATQMNAVRQLDLAPGLKNMDSPGVEGRSNAFQQLVINPGDSILLIAQLTGLSEKERKQGVSAELQLK